MHKRGFARFVLVISALVFALGLGQQFPQSISAQTPTGTIAYVVPNDTTGDQVWLIDPSGSNNHKIYSIGVADPYQVDAISSLVWRPDAGELVFASDHEDYCSWYKSDLYAILPNGSGYRRVTNGPACAGLASYQKGTVTVAAPYGYQVYVMGAPTLQFSFGGTTVFNNVADLGNTVQPVVAIDGDYRWMGPAVDVITNWTVNAGTISGWGSDEIGAFKPVWRRDGSRIGYAFGCASLYGIADQPAAGSWGQQLFSASGVSPCIMAWGSTAATASQIVYFTDTGNPGFYRTTENSTSAGTYLIQTADYDRVFGLQYLPDASGIILSITDNWGDSSNIYRYDFASDSATRLTNFTHEYARDFSISPDGQTIVFERAPEAPMHLYGGPSALWKMGINGTNMQLLVSQGAHPSWGASGTIVPPQGSNKVYLPLVRR